jgi:hypothetical protein
MQVLEDLPTDLAIKVVRKAPGTVAEKLQQLPTSCRHLAALGSCPGLDAACMRACELPDTRPSLAYLPVVNLCFDTSQEISKTFQSDELLFDPLGRTGKEEASGNGILSEKSSIWVHSHNVARQDRSLFCLHQRKRVIVCPLVARSKLLQDVTIVLPATACVVFGPGSLDVQRVTMKGVGLLQSCLSYDVETV